jgi:MFS superfamily sulfate permease-like transporter
MLSTFCRSFLLAFTVALLAVLESMLSAVVADSMTGDRHNPNVELVAQGIANITSPLFGGIPATGAIARTATNIRSGARSPVSGIVHALTLLLVLLVAAPLASYIPLATRAAVLFVVAYNMGEWREIAGILQLGFTAISVWLVTFALTVFADLTVAVGCPGLHLSHRRNHYRHSCYRRLHPRWFVSLAAGPHHPALRHAPAYSRPVFVWYDREAD